MNILIVHVVACPPLATATNGRALISDQGSHDERSPLASASVAAIVVTSEVVFASLFAYVFLSERLGWVQWLGAGLVISGVLALSLARRGTVSQSSW